jgi:hypothetical protein
MVSSKARRFSSVLEFRWAARIGVARAGAGTNTQDRMMPTERVTPMQTCLDDTGQQIVQEIYKAVNSLTDDPGLLSCIRCWGDTMSDDATLVMLKRWNEMGQPFAPDVRASGNTPSQVLQADTSDPRVATLLQTVADAVADAQEEGLDANLVLSLAAISIAEYGRLAFGDGYLDNLRATLQRLRGKKPPESNIAKICH